MTHDRDPLPAFLAAAFASAAATGLYFFFAQPISGSGAIMFGWENLAFAGVAFIAAFFIAALHIAILAGPLYAALAREASPGPVAILGAAVLIGALPLPLLLGGGDDWMLFGAMGLIGGIAFLTVYRRPCREGEG
jgi:hypothetical protein